MFYFLLSRFAFGDVNSDEDGFSDHESDDAGNDDNGNGGDATSGANNSDPVVTPQSHVPQEVATTCPPGIELEQANPSSNSQQPDMSSITEESTTSSEQPRAADAVIPSSAQQQPSTAAAVTEVPVSYPYLSRLEEQHHYKEEMHFANERKVICTLDLLLDVFEFKTCHKPGCKNDCTVKHHLLGPSVMINWTCSSGHKGRFESSRDVNELKSNNLQTAASILLSGNNFAKIEKMAKFLGLSFISESTFYRLQRLYFVPDINEWWTCQHEQIYI